MNYELTMKFEDGQEYDLRYAGEAVMVDEIRGKDYGLSQERVMELVMIAREFYFKDDYSQRPDLIALAVYNYSLEHELHILNFWEHREPIMELAYGYEG